jgi:hypothetical protein
LLIEADHCRAVNNRDRGALKTLIEQFLQRGFVGADILLDELDAFLR